MKAGLIKEVGKSFAPLMPPGWRKMGNEFMRREGMWIQIVTFNASRWNDKYVPRTCFEFLGQPGIPVGGYLVQELKNNSDTQRWVSASTSAEIVFPEMVRQFEPQLVEPLEIQEVKALLESKLYYWPHAYARCVMEAQEGNWEAASHYFETFLADVADTPYDWAEAARKELETCLSLMRMPSELEAHLSAIEAQKLGALKWK